SSDLPLFEIFRAARRPYERHERGPGHIDRLLALVVVGDGLEVRQNGKIQRPAARESRRPYHDLDYLFVTLRTLRIVFSETRWTRRPRLPEARKIIVGVENNRRDAEKCCLFDDSAQEHRLARTGASKNCSVSRQHICRECFGPALDAAFEAMPNRNGGTVLRRCDNGRPISRRDLGRRVMLWRRLRQTQGRNGSFGRRGWGFRRTACFRVQPSR